MGTVLTMILEDFWFNPCCYPEDDEKESEGKDVLVAYTEYLLRQLEEKKSGEKSLVKEVPWPHGNNKPPNDYSCDDSPFGLMKYSASREEWFAVSVTEIIFITYAIVACFFHVDF